MIDGKRWFLHDSPERLNVNLLYYVNYAFSHLNLIFLTMLCLFYIILGQIFV